MCAVKFPARCGCLRIGASRAGEGGSDPRACQQNGAQHAILLFDGDDAGEHRERPGQQRQGVGQAYGHRTLDAQGMHDDIAVPDDGDQDERPRTGSSRGLPTLRSIVQALAAYIETG